ncbi:MAG: VWA domain-containing protein, partial [Saprospiraceae bacterium]
VPDVKLVSQLIALSELIPEQTRSTARILVKQLADQLSKQLAPLFRQEVKGSLQKAMLNRHPSLKEMDWNRTIMANLRHYQPDYKTIIPEKKIGNKRIRKGLKKVILVVDQSASMADSVVYAGIIACILAKLPALDTHLVLFDSEYTDMSDQLDDPVDLLFGVQLGGGTDIGLALKYAGTLVESPADSLIFLISDLDEGVDTDEMMAQAFRIVQSGATFTTILNLSDQGDANWHATNAKAFRQLGIPCLCSDPSNFPKVLAESLLSKR